MKKIRVLMQNRIDLFEKKGGDFFQMIRWKEEIEKLGIIVDISTELDPNLSSYDIVHLFNVTRIQETYSQFINAKQQNTKVVITPIYHSVKEIEKFDNQGQYDTIKLFSKIFPNYYLREQTKNCLRFIQDKRQRECIVKVLKIGFKKAQQEVLQYSDLWVLIAENEENAIHKELEVKNRIVIAPNGTDISKITQRDINVQERYGIHDYILCVGRIEPRKNQLALIESLSGENVPLVFVGAINKNYDTVLNHSYIQKFKTIIKKQKNIVWLEEIPNEEIGSFYKAAKVHVNPSWFEVVSLVNLEAAALGANIVLSDVGYQREYFRNEAFYCMPENINSIKEATLKAYNQHNNNLLSERIKREYTWEKSAYQVMEAYQKVLSL